MATPTRTLGIDLGTTNTAVAIDGSVFQHRQGNETYAILSSVVAFPPSGTVIVGPNAKKRRAIDPKNTIASSKRLMGQTSRAYTTQKFKQQYPYDIVDHQGLSAFRTRAGIFTASDIATKILSRALTDLTVDPSTHDAVITVPAAFDAAARAATIEAGRAAGLRDVRVIPEPVATAQAYLTIYGKGQGKVAIYDLGGGTFDLAIVDCSVSPARVLAHAGDAYLGGDDVDQAIADWVAGEALQRFGCDLRSDVLVHDRLVVQCERAKARLGFAGQTRIEMAQVDPGATYAAQSITLDRARLDILTHELVGRSFALCDEVLRGGGLRAQDIDAVFMSGGSTLLPSVRDGVARYFGKLPRCDYDPMEVVAIGASLSSDLA